VGYQGTRTALNPSYTTGRCVRKEVIDLILSHLLRAARSKRVSAPLHRSHPEEQKRTPGVSAMQTNADENGTRTRATFVTRKYVKITLTWRHNQLGHLTYEFDGGSKCSHVNIQLRFGNSTTVLRSHQSRLVRAGIMWRVRGHDPRAGIILSFRSIFRHFYHLVE
jgi:hypothetical protein